MSTGSRTAIAAAVGLGLTLQGHGQGASEGPGGPEAEEAWVVYDGYDGPGKGRHVVLVSGDEEYRSEEALPQLGKILAVRHGFRCTVLFAINPEDGTIDPDHQTNIPGLEALDSADMMVIFTRFRELPDEQMRHLDDYVNSGKPILGLRTATHAFYYRRNRESPYARYGFRSEEWPGGFGRQVLGDTWIDHHGDHRMESTRGVLDPEHAEHPVLRGVDDIWGPSDVYGIENLIPEAEVLVWGQVLQGMKPTDPPVGGEKNQPMMPVVWTKSYTGRSGRPARVVTTTMGAAVDLESEGLRRLLVNAVYWGIGLDVPERADADYVGGFAPTFYGFGAARKGVKPAAHRLPAPE